MPTTLTEWQKTLEQHFAALAESRTGTPFPLFALEHGLASNDILAIKQLLRSRISTEDWLAPHWLVWVVYATEFGYEYFGDEYWQSFEEFTPYWREKAKRSFLRDWFVRFHQKYNGITPTGRWAQHFPIIAYPITHSILPRYLQHQFAKALFDLRYQLARLDDLSPAAIGEYLSQNVFDATSRFRQFLQQQELTGRLVLALLSNRTQEGMGPIFEPTLQRLVADLEEARSAKEWLSETRRLVADRIQGAHRSSGTSSDRQSIAKPKSVPDLKPSLLLRPNGNGSWSIVMQIPSFAPLLGALPGLRQFLMAARCRIAGSWGPAEALVNGNQKQVVLKTWPDPGQPLIKFDKPNPDLERVIAELRLSAGPVRLFRLGNDGRAGEVLGRTLRPGRRYFVLFDGDVPKGHALLEATTVACQTVGLASLAMPEHVSDPHVRLVKELGLHLVRTVRIWPVGMPAKSWDGEGVSEWLSTDRPCFALAHDHSALQAYFVSIDTSAPVRIDAPPPGYPAFIQLPQLPSGRHQLKVRAIARASNAILSGTDGTVTLSVRDPLPWIPGTTYHSGLFPSLDPPVPSLDDVIDGNMSATILGPSGHAVRVTITLAGKDGEDSAKLFDQELRLPVTASDWNKALSRQLSGSGLSWEVMQRTAGHLTIRGEELGTFRLALDRALEPVRWICREEQGTLRLRLREDTETEDPPVVQFYPFARPTTANSLAMDQEGGCSVLAPGGLFLAQKGGCRSVLAASAPQVARSLQELAVVPDLSTLAVAADNLIPALELLQLWLQARLMGPLAALRRARVVNAVLARIYSPFSGHRWTEAESNSQRQIDALTHAVAGPPGFAAVLRRDYARLNDAPETGKEWFADTANRYGVSRDRGLCEFALQFVSQPHRMTAPHVRPVLPVLLADLAKHAILLRGARLVAILSSVDEPAAEGVLLPRWKW